MPTKQKIREGVKKLTLFDDPLFRIASQDKEFCEEILTVFLDDPKLKVLQNIPQKDFTNLQGRSLFVDLFCLLGDNREVTVEIQKVDNLDHFRRVRYIEAVVTTNTTNPGDNFEKVPDVITIYITKFDILKKGKVKYCSKQNFIDYGFIIDDGSMRVFINSAINDGSKLAQLMQVFNGDRKYRKMFSKTNEIITKYTKNEEGISKMSDFIEKLFADEFQIIRQEKEAAEEKAKNAEEKAKNSEEEKERIVNIINKLNNMVNNKSSFNDIKTTINDLQKSTVVE